MAECPFDTRADAYDAWYDCCPRTFASELRALRRLLPSSGDWVEVGVGTGRFAATLGIKTGVEPAAAMAAYARARGVTVHEGVAEALPLPSESCDAVFFITALCFVRDVRKAFAEAWRVLRPGGTCIVAMLPKSSPLGRSIDAAREGDVFFRHAVLRETRDVVRDLEHAGLSFRGAVHTLRGSPARFEHRTQRPGRGLRRGSFVVLRAVRESGGANEGRPKAA